MAIMTGAVEVGIAERWLIDTLSGGFTLFKNGQEVDSNEPIYCKKVIELMRRWDLGCRALPSVADTHPSALRHPDYEYSLNTTLGTSDILEILKMYDRYRVGFRDLALALNEESKW